MTKLRLLTQYIKYFFDICTYITNNFAKFKVIDTNINEFLPIT